LFCARPGPPSNPQLDQAANNKFQSLALSIPQPSPADSRRDLMVSPLSFSKSRQSAPESRLSGHKRDQSPASTAFLNV
jgi:hypothetical protein